MSFKRLISILLFVQVVAPLVMTSSSLSQSNFEDIQGAWNQKCIRNLAQRNIISGYPDGSFRPNSPITRSEFAAIINKAFPNAAATRKPLQFSDVSANYWGYNAIREASRTKFLSGYPGNVFKPNQNIPRVQVLVALASGLNYSPTKIVPTSLNAALDDQNKIPNYARSKIAAATEKRLVVNYPNVRLLRPNELANRAEVAAFLCQALGGPNQVSLVPSQYIAGIPSNQASPSPAGTLASAPSGLKDTNYPIPSSAYFVSSDGKNTNSGKSPGSPWPVAKALASAPSGSTIVFRGGTYRNVRANIAKKLTLQAYPHEKPWLKGSIELQGWVANGGIWRKDGWKHSFPPDVGSEYIDPKHPMAGYRDMVYINGDSLQQVASIASVRPGTFYVDSANNKLYIGDNPAGKTVEVTALIQAFRILKPGLSTVVRGLGFAQYADRGIMVEAGGVNLENNAFVWNGVDGVRFGGKDFATDGIVRGNTFSYNGRKGIGGRGAHRILLEGNTISYNNIERFAKGWDAAGVKFSLTQGLTLRKNIVEHNLATGMWADGSVLNATIVDNTVRDNQGIGIQLELSHKAIVTDNVVSNNGVGIMIADTSSARVSNNTLSMNGKHIIVKDSPRVNTNAAEVAKGITWVTRNNVIKNNDLSSTRKRRAP